MTTSKKTHLWVLCACIALTTAIAPPALAQGAATSAQNEREFDIPSQPLNVALRAFAELTDLQLVYSSSLVAGLDSTVLKGKFKVTEALGQLLSGTGLTFRLGKGNAIVIEKASSDTRVLGPVRVEGADSRSAVNGVNGSRDVTATEGTGSFTSGALTVGSKMAQSIKDTPQSVSVITQQRIEEQNITDFAEAMNRATGVSTVFQGNTYQRRYYSRGFEIQDVQIDGGAPLTYSTAFGYTPLMDLAMYDHVEILRGAAGTFNGYGNPSGTINLSRKKPLDHRQVSLEALTGSWENYRAVLDATAPLGFDGALRGRVVMVYQDKGQFYDIAGEDRTVAYGVLDYDLTPSTLLTAGVNITRQDTVPFLGGLPRYQNGDDLDLSRDTCLCFPWNRWSFDTTEIFATAEQALGRDWTARLNVTHARQKTASKYGSSNGTVNPLTNTGPLISSSMSRLSSDQISAELTLTGAFEVLGQRQEVVVGVNHADINGAGRTQYTSLIAGTAQNPYVPYQGGPQYYAGSPVGSAPRINVFNFDPGDAIYTEPRDGLPSTRYLDYGQVRSGAYLNVRLTAFDRWHLVTGLRSNRFETSSRSEDYCTTTTQAALCAGKQIGDVYDVNESAYEDDAITWPPSVSLLYDLTNTMTAYLGYTDIYESQANYYDADVNPIDAVTGANVEVGLKWQARNGKLNATLAAYRIEKDGFAVRDESRRVQENGVTYYVANNGQRFERGVVDDSHNCCYLSDPNRSNLSKGVDLDVTGEVLPSLQLSVGYTWNKNEKKGSYFGTDPLEGEGAPLVSRAPQHLLKLFASYEFRRFSISGGAHWQSSAFAAGSACTELLPPNAQGVSSCAPGKNIQYAYTEDPYAVFSARLGYQVNDQWNVALAADNLTDEVYYQTMGTSTNGNWYGAPRSFALTLRGTF